VTSCALVEALASASSSVTYTDSNSIETIAALICDIQGRYRDIMAADVALSQLPHPASSEIALPSTACPHGKTGGLCIKCLCI
jgi:hypothetical protein